jgi:hypothetical protein
LSTVASAAEVYLHVGLPKTGTSYLQSLLWDSRATLREHGVLVPGDRRAAHNHAVWDLMGRRPRGADQPMVPGSWQAVVSEVRGWSGTHAVLSEEFLAFARARQARRAVDAFSPADVHVVVTVRDLARVLVGAWQQQLGKGHTWTWEEYAAAVRDPESGPAGAGIAFWLRQDVAKVLDNWESAVPRERIHVVTVPPAGSPHELLVQRFAAAVRVDPAWLHGGGELGNVSVGVAEAEVLRRLNLGLGNRLNERQYTRVVSNGLRPILQDRSHTARMGLPEEHRGWVSERAVTMIGELRSRGYHVEGDLDDLLPAPGSADEIRPDEVRPEALAEAAIAALQASVEQQAQLWWRFRTRESPTSADGTSRLTSLARTTAYRAKVSALHLADRNRLVRRALARYVSS